MTSAPTPLPTDLGFNEVAAIVAGASVGGFVLSWMCFICCAHSYLCRACARNCGLRAGQRGNGYGSAESVEVIYPDDPEGGEETTEGFSTALNTIRRVRYKGND